jgi:hypothetical protein
MESGLRLRHAGDRHRGGVVLASAATILHDGHPYSMPPEAISMPATLYLYADRVRIVAGRYEVTHPRKFIAHEGSTLAAHRAALVRYRGSEASAI